MSSSTCARESCGVSEYDYIILVANWHELLFISVNPDRLRLYVAATLFWHRSCKLIAPCHPLPDISAAVLLITFRFAASSLPPRHYSVLTVHTG
jgi:hypothetical protein